MNHTANVDMYYMINSYKSAKATFPEITISFFRIKYLF